MEIGTTDTDSKIKALRNRLRNANVAPVYWNQTFKKIGGKAVEVEELFTKGKYQELVRDGIGLCFHGAPEPRYRLGMTFAKTAVAIGSSLLQLSLPELEAAIRFDTDTRAEAAKVKQLMLTRFEKDIEFPYDRYTHFRIEEFLEQRYRDGDKITHFEMCKPMKLSRWWSPDFTAIATEKLLPIES